MDIELARTFLDIVRTGSFMAAAERLHITQTTVTARIQNLEEQLDCKLFVRNRSGAKLTDDGERFMGYASQLVQTWDAARRHFPLPSGFNELLAFGGGSQLIDSSDAELGVSPKRRYSHSCGSYRSFRRKDTSGKT
jgi:LysR family transcriptional regulator, flagellar master operon regulator